MKRLLLIAVCLASVVATAQVQKIPYYAEVYNEKTDKLAYKEWRSAEGHLRQEQPRNDGTSLITIYRADSLKFYTIAEKTKTVAELPFSKLTPGEMLGVVKDAGSTREFLRRETVEGYDCAVYKIIKHRALANGQSEESYHTEWYYEPLDLVIRYVESLNAMNNITRNIRQGAQPAHLFELPTDYKNFDMGAAIQQMRGQVDGAKKTQEQPQSIQQQQERFMEAFKKMGGGKK